MKYIITDEQIEKIKNLINQRNLIKARTILDDLEIYKNPLKEELRKFLMNKGKSTILKSEIYEILDKYKENE